MRDTVRTRFDSWRRSPLTPVLVAGVFFRLGRFRVIGKSRAELDSGVDVLAGLIPVCGLTTSMEPELTGTDWLCGMVTLD